MWSGPYYAVGSNETLNGVIYYTETDSGSYTRLFEKREQDGALTREGSDKCTKDS
jgi:hypothetical protein